MTVPTADREVLSAIFAARLSLIQKTEDEAAEEARVLRRRAIMWFSNNSQVVGSFMWFCDKLDLEAGAVRRAVKEG